MNIKNKYIKHLEFLVVTRTFLVSVFFLFICFTGTIHADKRKEVIIISENTRTSQELVNSIKKEFILNQRSEQLKVLSLKDLRKNTSKNLLENKILLIPIGTRAIDYCIKSKTNSPFIASFTTESAFAAISATASSQAVLRKNFVGGISLDQPSQRLSLLAKMIKPNLRSTGVVLGPNSRLIYKNIQRYITQIGSSLTVANIGTNDNPVKKLRNVFQKSQLFIVFPDKANFNRSLARWIIALSYKHQVPVISYSKKYAEAGALASLYSRPDQIGKQTAQMALSYLRKGSKARKLLPPKYFDLTINKSVKKALNLSFPSKDELLRKLAAVTL